MAKVEILPPFRVVEEGTIYTAGDTADVPDALANHWEASGWAKPAKTPATKK